MRALIGLLRIVFYVIFFGFIMKLFGGDKKNGSSKKSDVDKKNYGIKIDENKIEKADFYEVDENLDENVND